MAWMLDVGGVAVAIPAAVALGAGVGLVSGMFGVGGGFLLIPLLHVVLNIPLPLAIGAVLCQAIASSIGSLVRYRKLGHAETRLDILLLGGSIPGVALGAAIVQSLSTTGSTHLLGKEIPMVQLVVTFVFAAIFLTIAMLLWLKAPISTDELIEPGPLAKVRLPPLVKLPTAGLEGVSALVISYLGLALGILSGLLGIGGGVVLIPIMLYGFGFNIRKAAGTGIIMILCVSLIGTFEHSRMGHVHLGLAMALMGGSAIAAQLGASLTHRLDPAHLRRALAVIIVAANIALLFKVFA